MRLAAEIESVRRKYVSHQVTTQALASFLVITRNFIFKADNFVFHAAHGKLKIIEEQMAFLRKQAMQILVETKINSVLHSLPCNFSKKPGHVYSVYQKSDGSYQFSMISPEVIIGWNSS